MLSRMRFLSFSSGVSAAGGAAEDGVGIGIGGADDGCRAAETAAGAVGDADADVVVNAAAGPIRLAPAATAGRAGGGPDVGGGGGGAASVGIALKNTLAPPSWLERSRASLPMPSASSAVFRSRLRSSPPPPPSSSSLSLALEERPRSSDAPGARALEPGWGWVYGCMGGEHAPH